MSNQEVLGRPRPKKNRVPFVCYGLGPPSPSSLIFRTSSTTRTAHSPYPFLRRRLFCRRHGRRPRLFCRRYGRGTRNHRVLLLCLVVAVLSQVPSCTPLPVARWRVSVNPMDTSNRGTLLGCRRQAPGDPREECPTKSAASVAHRPPKHVLPSPSCASFLIVSILFLKFMFKL